MSALKETALTYINDLSEDNIKALLPLLKQLTDNSFYCESVTFDELTKSEKSAVLKGRQNYDDGDYIDFEEYTASRGI